MKHIVVLGNGITSKLFIYYLLKKSSNFKITQISCDDKFPPCSINSSSFVSLRGTNPGLSPLGEIIYDSYFFAKDFFEVNQPDGVTKGQLKSFSYTGDNHEKFLRRFPDAQKKDHYYVRAEEAYFITPTRFLKWIDEQTTGHNFINEEVINIEQDFVQTSNNDYAFDYLFVGTSAYSKIYSDRYPKSEIILNSNVIRGDFVSFPKDLGDISFGLENEHGYLIYRSDVLELLVGATTLKEPFPNNFELLKEQFNKMKGLIELELPQFETGKIFSGFRHKGKKRLPFWGNLFEKDNIYGVLGTYKNGYSIPFLACYRVVNDLLKK